MIKKENFRTVFDYENYKTYVNQRIRALPHRGHGERSRLASALKCQTAYISQVLNGSAHLSLEQGEATNRFFHHTADEGHFFILLIQLTRAGTPELRKYFAKQIERIHADRLVLANRLEVKSLLSPENQATYYSSWHYAAIHVALSIPELQVKERLARKLGLTMKRTLEALEFLCDSGLAIREGERFKIGPARLHLPSESPLISRHHANWRMRAIDSADERESENLHYSSVVTLSEADFSRIKGLLIENIQAAKEVIRASPEEEVVCFSLDLFRLNAGT